jgi:hypothetical protein
LFHVVLKNFTQSILTVTVFVPSDGSNVTSNTPHLSPVEVERAPRPDVCLLKLSKINHRNPDTKTIKRRARTNFYYQNKTIPTPKATLLFVLSFLSFPCLKWICYIIYCTRGVAGRESKNKLGQIYLNIIL